MRILLVEDTPRIRSFIERGLREEGHSVVTACDLQTAADALLEHRIDVVVLDRMLPDGDGLDLVRGLRRADDALPVICLTARDRVAERVEGLRAGADDYLVKPFSFEELLARLESVTRRTRGPDHIEVGSLAVDVERRKVSRGGRSIELTAREFDLLVELMRSHGRVLSRTRLLDRVWGLQHDPGTNRVDVFVRALRKKLGQDLIHTVRGVGYTIDPERLGNPAATPTPEDPA